MSRFAKGSYPLAILCLLALFAFPIFGTEDSHEAKAAPYAWERVLDELSEQRDQLSAQLENARAMLLARAQTENPDLLARLYLERPRRSGYQVVPAIQADKPLASTKPGQRTYSIEALRERIKSNLHAAVHLTERAQSKPEAALTPLVIEFERLRERLYSMERRLAYHANWQRAVVEQGGFYAERNRIAKLTRKLDAVLASGGSAERVTTLRQSLRERVTKFTPTANLAIKTNAAGLRILSVAVYTDIDDGEFLAAFQEGVGAAFTRSEAARKLRFAVSLDIRRVMPTELYPAGAPARGTSIDLKDHRARFPEGALVLTTGGESTHAWVGRNITLGPNPTTRRTLAHEFGHLLGFSDAYLRSYQGNPRDPYGVVLLEWVGLVDNLMGNPGTGRVTNAMIETLIEAYGESQHK